MSLDTILLVFIVAYGTLSLWADVASFIRRLRAANDDITNVLTFERGQQALRQNTTPRSLP